MKPAFIEIIHGTLISVMGVGVLLRGESGSGKSDCALELISRGHILIADDAVSVERIDEVLFGSSADCLTGLLAVRGLGICDIGQLYGNSSVADRCEIGLCINLRAETVADDYEKFGCEQLEVEIMGMKIPYFVISNSTARPLSVIVETVVRMLKTGVKTAETSLIVRYDKAVAG